MLGTTFSRSERKACTSVASAGRRPVAPWLAGIGRSSNSASMRFASDSRERASITRAGSTEAGVGPASAWSGR